MNFAHSLVCKRIVGSTSSGATLRFDTLLILNNDAKGWWFSLSFLSHRSYRCINKYYGTLNMASLRKHGALIVNSHQLLLIFIKLIRLISA
jgi:hypothetical protein